MGAILAALLNPATQAAFSFLLSAGPKAIQLIEDMSKGNLTPEEVSQRWDEARAQYEAGRKAWDDAGGSA